MPKTGRITSTRIGRIAYAISPFIGAAQVDSTMYSTSSMLRTMS